MFPLHRTLSSSQRYGKTFINCACRLTADGIFRLSPLSPLFPAFGAANAQHGEDKHSMEDEDRAGDRRAVRGEVGPKRRVKQAGLDEGSDIDTVRRNIRRKGMSKCLSTLIVPNKTRCYHQQYNRN